MSLEPHRTGTATSPDGTRIAWQRFGEGPAVLVANGIGVSWRGMAPQIAHLLQGGNSVITWDYRGLFGSSPPGNRGLGVPAHAEDAVAVLDAAGVTSPPWLSWSMGVNVAFEAAARAPERVHGIIAIGGVPWSPFRAFAGRGLHRVLRLGSKGLVPLAPMASPVMRRTLPTNAFFSLSKSIRYIRGTTDADAFRAMAADVASHDHRVYMRTLSALGHHDMRGRLASIRTPVVLLVGGKDFLIRPSVARRVAAQLPCARVEVIPDTSHFMHLEDVASVNTAIDRFLEHLPERRFD